MSRKSLLLALVSCVVIILLLVFPVSFVGESIFARQGGVVQSGILQVHNLNTTLSYSTIQEAVDADETLTGHVIRVDSGVYNEHVSVNKSLSLVSEDRSSTVISALKRE